MTRQVYLGASRDYVVETADGTRAARRHADRDRGDKGREVWLTCRPIAAGR